MLISALTADPERFAPAYPARVPARRIAPRTTATTRGKRWLRAAEDEVDGRGIIPSSLRHFQIPTALGKSYDLRRIEKRRSASRALRCLRVDRADIDEPSAEHAGDHILSRTTQQGLAERCFALATDEEPENLLDVVVDVRRLGHRRPNHATRSKGSTDRTRGPRGCYIERDGPGPRSGHLQVLHIVERRRTQITAAHSGHGEQALIGDRVGASPPGKVGEEDQEDSEGSEEWSDRVLNEERLSDEAAPSRKIRTNTMRRP